MGTEKKGNIVGQANKGIGEPKIRGNRCSCAVISLRALETLRWIMWTKGSIEVYPTLSKTAGCLVEQASRRKTNKILPQMSIVCTYVSSEHQMFITVGPHWVELHMKRTQKHKDWKKGRNTSRHTGNVKESERFNGHKIWTVSIRNI